MAPEAKFWIEPQIELARNHGLSDRDLARIEGMVQDHEQEIRDAWTRTSIAEVTNISQHGFWVLVDERELFLPFDEFPWFRAAPVEAILRLEVPHPGHLYWPDLDVDLSVSAIEDPDRYPLKSRA